MAHVYLCDWPEGPACICPRDPVTGALIIDEPAPAAASLAAGAIARSLSDAAEAYRRQTLTYLVDQGPWDD